jgi:hypothetical protein
MGAKHDEPPSVGPTIERGGETMSTHIQTLTAALDEIGIEYVRVPGVSGAHDYVVRPPAVSAIVIEGGYAGFFHIFEFDAEGALTEHGSYE